MTGRGSRRPSEITSRAARRVSNANTAVRNGDWRWLLARGRCLRDEAGKPYRFVGSAIDVTTRKQAQSDREQLEAQLRQSQKMEAMGTLAGGIAHDFNNILGAILGYGELAQQESAPESALRRYIDNVMHAAERAKALVDRILGFSRSGLGERAHVHIQSVIEETLELIAASLPANIRLEKTLAAGDAALIGDSTQLHQVAMNLCTNAIHAMERGGVLSVLLERGGFGGGAIGVARHSLPGAPYTPRDQGYGQRYSTGCGRTHIRSVFHHPRGRQRYGAGPIARAWDRDGFGRCDRCQIRDWRGQLALRSGCRSRSQAGKPAVESVRELPRGRGETVMIVDDEPALVALAEEMLAGLGYEPVGFESSDLALQAFRARPERFDLVLTDEAMPDLVGTALAREIRLLRPDVPIILMSGHGGAPLAHRAAAIGVKEVLHKPLQRVDLAESLARALDHRGTAGVRIDWI